MSKKPIVFDPSMLYPIKACEPGCYVVSAHTRTLKDGREVQVKQHCRTNCNATHSIYVKENLYHLYYSSCPSYPKLGKICGFEEHPEIDSAIQYWLDFWKAQGLPFPEGLHPRIIKAMIAVESSFNPKARVKKGSARGLMQILDKTRKVLAGNSQKSGYVEMKDHNIKAKPEDLFDPMVNIAAGTRWFSHKHKLILKGHEKSVFNTLRNYNDWYGDGENYAKKVIELSEKVCSGESGSR